MTSKKNKQAEAPAALDAGERARLERFAESAQSTPEEIWPSVYRYGFDDIEETVQAGLDAEDTIANGGTTSHEELMAQAMQIIAQHGQRKRKIG
jgi:hypothetical protein